MPSPEDRPALTPAQSRRLEQLFASAATLSPDERLAFCARTCRDDPILCAEFVSLLAVLGEEAEDAPKGEGMQD